MLGTLKVHISYNILTSGKLQYLTSLNIRSARYHNFTAYGNSISQKNVDTNYYTNLQMSLPPLYLKQKQGTDPYLGHMSHTYMYKSITGEIRVLQYVQCYYI